MQSNNASLGVAGPSVLSRGSAPCRLLVWEQTATWAAGLRAALGGAAKPVEIRFQEAAEEELELSPCSVLVVEITAENIARLISWLAKVRNRWPEAVPIAAAERGLSAWEGIAREAGAEAWVESPSRLGGVARMVRRQLLRYPAPLPDLRTAWRDRLPW